MAKPPASGICCWLPASIKIYKVTEDKKVPSLLIDVFYILQDVILILFKDCSYMYVLKEAIFRKSFVCSEYVIFFFFMYFIDFQV